MMKSYVPTRRGVSHENLGEGNRTGNVRRDDAFFPPNYVRLYQSCAGVVLLTSLLCLPVPIDHSGHPNIRTQLTSLASNQKRVDPFDLFSLTGGYKI